MGLQNFISALEKVIFRYRPLVILVFVLMTVVMLYSATHLRVDAGFEKQVPMQHPYMVAYQQYRADFGGANRLVVALMAKKGDIFTPEFFQALQQATNDVFFLHGVDRSRVMSLFTPNVRYTEVDEEGFVGGNIVPPDFKPTPEWLGRVRKNILNSPYVGKLVANDFSGAIITAELLDVDPKTGEKIDYLEIADKLEKIREKYQSDKISVHVLGFAMIVSEIAAGTLRVVLFFGIAFLITAIMVFIYSRSLKLTILPLLCSLIAVVWQLGFLPLVGVGIDPMGILVPFLIFAIGVSHAVQMVRANGAKIFDGADALTASRQSFRSLIIPGMIALASDALGFFVIRLIKIQVIQDMALTASVGVVMVAFTNLILLPVLLSYLHYSEKYRLGLSKRAARMAPVWRSLAGVTKPRNANLILLAGLLLLGLGLWRGLDVKVGDLHQGVPELRADSRLNQDIRVVDDHFTVGMDVLVVFSESHPNGCVDYEVVREINELHWYLLDVKGVKSVNSMPRVMEIINAGWNEGHPQWQELPRNPSCLAQDSRSVSTSTGLLNTDASVMPLYVDLVDHKAETINRVVAAVERYQREHPQNKVKFRLAGGNVGVMAATNQEVVASQYPILLCVFGAVILLCQITFRSLRATMCIILPLALVSLLGYALMSFLEIGLKVSTLPVVALGVGVGVDYGIYIYSRLQDYLKEGLPLYEAYEKTMEISGNAVLLTGATLAAGVATWIFSPLKFQADMGILLTFMFLVNMLGAIFLLPVLRSKLHGGGR